MKNPSTFDIFLIKKEKAAEETPWKWVRSRFSEEWGSKDLINFQRVLRRHQEAINSVKEKEEMLEKHNCRILEIKKEYTLEEGEIVDDIYRKFTRQRLIEDEKRKIEICERNISRIKAKIVFFESYMYCKLTKTEHINIVEHLNNMRTV